MSAAGVCVVSNRKTSRSERLVFRGLLLDAFTEVSITGDLMTS